MKTAEQFITFGQGNVEALVKSGQIVATGLQDMSKQVTSHAQTALDDGMSTMRAMTGVKSFREALDLQTSFMRATFERAMSQTGSLTQASIKLTEQAMQPLAGRMSIAADSFKPA